MNLPEKYPQTASLTLAEFTVWLAAYHPDACRPTTSKDVLICPPSVEIRLGIAKTLRCAYSGGRYSIDAIF